MEKQEEDNINFFIKNNLLRMQDYDSAEIMTKFSHEYYILF